MLPCAPPVSYNLLGGFVVESNPAGNCLALVVVMAGLLGLCGAFRSLQAEVPIGCASCCSRGFREIKEGRDHLPNVFLLFRACVLSADKSALGTGGGGKGLFCRVFRVFFVKKSGSGHLNRGK